MKHDAYAAVLYVARLPLQVLSFSNDPRANSMTTFASVSLTLATIPILAALALLGLSVFFVARRGALVGQARRTIKDEYARVIREEQDLQQQLVGSVLAGKSLPEASDTFVRLREALVPGASADRPGHWSPADLERHTLARFMENAAAISRRILTQACVVGVSILAATVVGMTVVYSLHTPREVDAGSVPAPPQATPNHAPEPTVEPPSFPLLKPEVLVPLETPSPASPNPDTQKLQPAHPVDSAPKHVPTVTRSHSPG